MLYKQTISPFLGQTLENLMKIEKLNEYVLVGGTALSLLLGHRRSVDIDMFRPDYKKGEEIKATLLEFFPRNEIRTLAHGATVYLPEPKSFSELKIDFMSNEPFIRPVQTIEGIRIAHLEDLAAMKLEAITHRLVHKDFWDIAEILEHYSLKQMTDFYKQRYPWNDLRGVFERLVQVDKIEDKKSEVIPLNHKKWNDIIKSINSAFEKFVNEEKQLNTPLKNQNRNNGLSI